MALTVTHTFSDGATIEASELNQNFTDVENKFSGGIANADISADAAIANSKLANDIYEVTLSIQLTGTEIAGASANDMFLVGSIPYDATDGNQTYTILGIEHATWLTTTRVAETFDLDFWDGSSWTTIKSGITTGTASGFTQTRESSFTTSVSTNSGGPRFFRLELVNTTGTMAARDHFALTIKLKRDSGLRS